MLLEPYRGSAVSPSSVVGEIDFGLWDSWGWLGDGGRGRLREREKCRTRHAQLTRARRVMPVGAGSCAALWLRSCCCVQLCPRGLIYMLEILKPTAYIYIHGSRKFEYIYAEKFAFSHIIAYKTFSRRARARRIITIESIFARNFSL